MRTLIIAIGICIIGPLRREGSAGRGLALARGGGPERVTLAPKEGARRPVRGLARSTSPRRVGARRHVALEAPSPGTTPVASAPRLIEPAPSDLDERRGTPRVAAP